MYRSTDINNFRSPSAAERELIFELTAAKTVGQSLASAALPQRVRLPRGKGKGDHGWSQQCEH
jgi:hypothetical protein